METACKNTEAMDSSIFEGQHFTNVPHLVDCSKACDVLMHAVINAALTAITVPLLLRISRFSDLCPLALLTMFIATLSFAHAHHTGQPYGH